MRLKPACHEDCERLFAWANDPETRRSSLHSDPIDRQTHVAWFARKQNDPNCLLLIGEEENGKPIGQIRFDMCGETAEVSISLAPEQRGRGYGTELIVLGAQYCFAHTSIVAIHAWIKSENTASLRAFERAGFHAQGIRPHQGFLLHLYTLPYPNT